MPHTIEACFFVEQPPEFDYRDGLFHIVQTVGNYRFERVMAPHVFMRTLRRAAECARKHKFGGADIIPFRKDEAASA